MQHYDFLSETIDIELPLPFTYEKSRITSVRLKKLYAPDISKLKSAISAIPDTVPERLRYMMYAREMSLAGVECFIDDNGADVKNFSPKFLVDKCPTQNTYKMMLFVTMLTAEKSLVTTSYKCSSCGKFSIFDLDPSQEVPKDIEEERGFMEDIISFMKEKINKTGHETFEYTLASPIILQSDKPVSIFKLSFKYPSMEDYIKCLRDIKRKDLVDLWVLFDNLERINDISIPDTSNIKDKYGFDKIFRMKNVDAQGLVDKLNEFGVYIQHEHTCKICGYKNTNAFDMTNFFDFLRMS